MGTMTYTDTLTILDCGACHISFAIPDNLYRKVRRDGSRFWCPNGDKIHYFETDTKRLEREKDELERRLASERENTRAARAATKMAREQTEHERRRAAALKGHATRLKNRIGRGKCPACSETFPNIAEHIACEHPGFGES